MRESEVLMERLMELDKEREQTARKLLAEHERLDALESIDERRHRLRLQRVDALADERGELLGVDDRVHGGEPHTEDYDEGEILEMERRGDVPGAYVAWNGGLTESWAPLSTLKRGHPGLWAVPS